MKIYKLVLGMLATNCYIVASKQGRAFVIDPGGEADRIKDFLAAHKLQAEATVNTHGHFDHVAADADLGLPVYIHEDDAVMVRNPQEAITSAMFGTFKPVEPRRLLRDSDTITLDDLDIAVIHTPGHTPGGICLLLDQVLFSGDTLFRDGIGRTDFPGASPELMARSLKRLAGLKPSLRVYPGHGPETTLERELHGQVN